MPRKVTWWDFRSFGYREWTVCEIHGIYSNARSRKGLNDQYSEEFGVEVGEHQGSALSLLFPSLALDAF